MPAAPPATRRTPADLAAAILRARELYVGTCRVCPWRCGVDRTRGERGFCGVADGARVGRELVHFGEEIDLIPSWAVYLTGCNLRCTFCMSGEMVEHPELGFPLEPQAFGALARRRMSEGAANLNALGGEPTVNLLALLEALVHVPQSLPLVLNTNLYYTEETAAILEAVVDVYLADFKFGDDGCATRIAGAPEYRETVERNLIRAAASGARVIVRHLLMPGHESCCCDPVIEWLAQWTPRVEVSIMDAYVPLHRAPGGPLPELRGFNPRGAGERAKARAQELGLTLVR